MKACLSFSAVLPIVMAALAGCASRQSSAGAIAAAAPIASREGRYTFDERPAGTERTLEGTFIVLEDTVLVDATPGPCRYDSHSTSGGPIVYKCADVSLSFDRRDPATKATYDFTTSDPKPKVVCVRYTVGPNGTQQCAETRTDFVNQSVEHSGTLRPHRVDTSPTTRPTP